ncbi:MAG: DinB family protein [Bryobacteraceae bacterium]|jgi:DinB superfamily
MKYAALLTLITASAAFAAETPLGQAFDKNLSGVESEFVSLAEAMPASAYNFAPTAGEFKGVRTFAQQVKHVAAVNYLIGSAILGEKPPRDTGGEAGPASVATKEQIVPFLKDSFVYLHKAMVTLTAQNLTQMVQSPFGKNQTPRSSLALEAAAHCFDHYGQMVVYARMNKIVPPASR